MMMVDTIIVVVGILIDLKVVKVFIQATESPIKLIVVNISTLSSIITGNYKVIIQKYKPTFLEQLNNSQLNLNAWHQTNIISSNNSNSHSILNKINLAILQICLQ